MRLSIELLQIVKSRPESIVKRVRNWVYRNKGFFYKTYHVMKSPNIPRFSPGFSIAFVRLSTPASVISGILGNVRQIGGKVGKSGEFQTRLILKRKRSLIKGYFEKNKKGLFETKSLKGVGIRLECEERREQIPFFWEPLLLQGCKELIEKVEYEWNISN